MKFLKSVCIETMYLELPFLERFEAAKRDGFDFVEFWGFTDKDMEAVRAAAEKAEIGISGFNGDGPYSLIDPTQKGEYLSYLAEAVKAAGKAGAQSLTIHSNALGEGGVVIDYYAGLSDTVKVCSMYDTLRECAKMAEHSGIAMNLEPLNTVTDHVGNFLRTTQMAAEMTQLIGSSKLKVLYDVYHMQLNEGDICGHISKFAGQFGHIHVADVPGRHEPGTGEICCSRVFAQLEAAGYAGKIGFELFPETTTASAVKAIMSY